MFNGPFGKVNTEILLDRYIKAYEGACDAIEEMRQITKQLRGSFADGLKLEDSMLKLLSGDKILSEVQIPQGGAEKFRVTIGITYEDNNKQVTLDHTYKEISEAYNSGKEIIGVYGGAEFRTDVYDYGSGNLRIYINIITESGIDTVLIVNGYTGIYSSGFYNPWIFQYQIAADGTTNVSPSTIDRYDNPLSTGRYCYMQYSDRKENVDLQLQLIEAGVYDAKFAGARWDGSNLKVYIVEYKDGKCKGVTIRKIPTEGVV